MRGPERYALAAADAADECRPRIEALLVQDITSWPGSADETEAIEDWGHRIGAAFALVGALLEALDGLQAELEKVAGDALKSGG
jgi:hypothetical protein